MTQAFRAAAPVGYGIDRSKRLRFTFDRSSYEGYMGDTLASALLANGVHRVARSFKYHRPRGIYAAGSEEPNALVRLHKGALAEPNTRATQVELFDGLAAESQNRWPSLAFDMGAAADVFSRLLPAGFYYKTFMWPPSFWNKVYEPAIRAAAGMGVAPGEPDPDEYEHQHAHCDVLVIGGGPSGLAAARAAARAGARTVLCDESAWWGGRLGADPATIDDSPEREWIAALVAELEAAPRVRLLARTTAFGYYDHNLVGLVERLQDQVLRQRLWKMRAKQVVLAAGAIEQPLVFGDNDLPGVMLAGAMRRYARQFGVLPGRRVALAGCDDAIYATASVLGACGVEVAAVIDLRTGSSVTRALGGARVEAVEFAHAGGASARVECDALGVCGGFNPTVHLFAQSRGAQVVQVVGAAAGRVDLADCLRDGHAAGVAAAERAGYRAAAGDAPRAEPRAGATAPATAPVPGRGRGGAKRFVDLQNDVTVDDIDLAVREGYRSVEHIKRYTTLGMGTDQGKTSNLAGAAVLADRLGRPIVEVGTTTFRPPYTPVTLGALAGRERGAHAEPTRLTPMHAWHVSRSARFITAGLWLRPQLYPLPGESDEACIEREVLNVRSHVGIVDVSTLGKIELQGPDTAEFLNRVYVNNWHTLAVGRARYGLMLREDGFVFDDGTTSRLAEHHYLMTTTTANAVAVMRHLEFLLQAVWPELRVWLASVTDQWAAAALAGPNARKVLEKLADIDVLNAALAFLGVRSCRVAGIPARLLRVSYSGELAYEIHVPAGRGLPMWEAVMDAGRDFGIQPYGTEAMGVLRIEKGHIVTGAEADGRTTPDDLGLGALVAQAKDCIGKRLLERPALDPRSSPERWQLVGLTALAGGTIPRGAKLVRDPKAQAPVPMEGHVTSWCYSPHVKAPIALALLAGGRRRHGEELYACSPLAGEASRVRVGPPCFLDPHGERLRA